VHCRTDSRREAQVVTVRVDSVTDIKAGEEGSMVILGGYKRFSAKFRREPSKKLGRGNMGELRSRT